MRKYDIDFDNLSDHFSDDYEMDIVFPMAQVDLVSVQDLGHSFGHGMYTIRD